MQRRHRIKRGQCEFGCGGAQWKYQEADGPRRKPSKVMEARFYFWNHVSMEEQ